MNLSPTAAAIVMLIGVVVVWLAVKGRIRPVWDAFLSGNIQETGSPSQRYQ